MPTACSPTQRKGAKRCVFVSVAFVSAGYIIQHVPHSAQFFSWLLSKFPSPYPRTMASHKFLSLLFAPPHYGKSLILFMAAGTTVKWLMFFIHCRPSALFPAALLVVLDNFHSYPWLLLAFFITVWCSCSSCMPVRSSFCGHILISVAILQLNLAPAPHIISEYKYILLHGMPFLFFLHLFTIFFLATFITHVTFEYATNRFS